MSGLELNVPVTDLGETVEGVLQGGPSGLQLGLSTVTMAADANQTLTVAQAASPIVAISGGTSLTATLNIVLPVAVGCFKVVANLSTGSQSLQFIGATGTGITVATGKRAVLYCDGTNWVRVTPDT